MDRPKKYVSSLEFEDSTPATISLQELEGKSVFERVSVNIKVTRKIESEFVATGKMKQDVIACDSSGTLSGKSPWHSQDLSEMQCESRAVHLNTGKMHKVGVCDVATVRHLYRSTICKDALHGRL